MEVAIRQASRLVETARREPLGISLTRLTISMPRPWRPVRRAMRSASGCCAPSIARGTRPEARAGGPRGGGGGRGGARRLQQAQVVAGEIEDLGKGGDVRGGAEIHAGQAQH